MKVLKNKLALFVGCGITADSKPSREWAETKIKTQTLLGVLNQGKTGLKVFKKHILLPMQTAKKGVQLISEICRRRGIRKVVFSLVPASAL